MTPFPYRLIFVRHGETSYNAENRLQGQLDVPLNERGRDQARAIGRTLRARLGADFRLMSGDDATAPAFLALGGDGCISVASNVAPGLCRALYLQRHNGHSPCRRRLVGILDRRDHLGAGAGGEQHLGGARGQAQDAQRWIANRDLATQVVRHGVSRARRPGGAEPEAQRQRWDSQQSDCDGQASN